MSRNCNQRDQPPNGSEEFEYSRKCNRYTQVIVDYLQVIAPMDMKQSTKDVVDTHVRALKKLQKEKDLVAVLVSSLNRQNYLTPIDY